VSEQLAADLVLVLHVTYVRTAPLHVSQSGAAAAVSCVGFVL
jgi:hypothetical protein